MDADDAAPLRVRPGVTAWSSAGDEVVVLDVERSTYLGLNDTAALLWQLLVRGTSRDDMVRALLAEYHVDAEVARREVLAFVEDLRRRGYLDGA